MPPTQTAVVAGRDFLPHDSFCACWCIALGINWARLGKPERRVPVWAAGAFALLLPIAVFIGALWLDITINRVSVRPFIACLSIVVAYWQLFEQRPIFDAHIARGGRAGSTLTLWLCVLLIGLFLALTYLTHLMTTEA